jgi:hypothetical protein
MVNCWFSESNNKTACGRYGGETARAVSVDDWSVVSCPDCEDADYPDVSAHDIELRDFGYMVDDNMATGADPVLIDPSQFYTATDERHKVMIFRRNTP